MAWTGTVTYEAEKDLNLWFNAASYTPATSLDLALDTGNVGVSGLQFEVSSGNGYAELAVTANTTNFPTISSGVTITNNTTIAFATATGAWTGNSGANTTCKGVVIKDSTTIGSGNQRFAGVLTTAETVVNNDVLQFTAGNFSCTMN
jgi:hypothetical protein